MQRRWGSSVGCNSVSSVTSTSKQNDLFIDVLIPKRFKLCILAAVTIFLIFANLLPGMSVAIPNAVANEVVLVPQEPAKSNVEAEIKITYAEFGTGRGKAVCTGLIQSLVNNSKSQTTITSSGLKLKNPTGVYRNRLLIRYTIDGKPGELSLGNKKRVNIRTAILENGGKGGTTSSNRPVPPSSSSPGPQPSQTASLNSNANIKFESKVQRFCAGAGGRILLLHLPDSDQLVIVDLVARKIVKKLPVTDDVCFAANAEHFFIGLPRSNQLQRWSLKTLEKETVAFLDRENPPSMLVMGSAGKGPLGLLSKGRLFFWDPDTLKQIPFPEELQLSGYERYDYRVCVSADGKTFCGKTNGLSSQPFQILRLDSNQRSDTEPHSMNEAWAMPTADGNFLLRYGEYKADSYDLKHLPIPEFKNEGVHPTEDPRYFLAFAKVGKNKSKVSICSLPDFRRVWTESGLPSTCKDFLGTVRGRLHLEPRIRFLPNEKLLACLADDDQTLHIRSLDIAAKLKQTGKPYLFFNSKPPATLTPGQTLDYSMDVLSSSPAKFNLDIGPDGMTVSADGKLHWEAPSQPGTFDAIVSATTGDGKKATHSLTFFVGTPKKIDGTDNKLADAPNNNRMKPQGPSGASAAKSESETAATAENGTGSVAGETKLELPGKPHRMAMGGGGRYMLIQSKEAKQLYIIDLIDKKLLESLPLQENHLFCATQEHFFIYYPENKALERYRFKGMKKELAQRLPLSEDAGMMVSGSSGDGPVGIWSKHRLHLVDTESLRVLPEKPQEFHNLPQRTAGPMTVSADGHTFCSWTGFGLWLLRWQPDYQFRQEAPSQVRWAQPSANGGLVFTHEDVLDYDLVSVGTEKYDHFSYLPTDDPRFAIRVNNIGRKGSTINLVTAYGFEPLTEDIATPLITDSSGRLNDVPRVRFLAEPGRLAVVPDYGNEVIIYELPEVEKLATGKLVLCSVPTPFATVGKNWSYQLQTLHNETLKYEVKSGPEGMSVDSKGLVSWKPETRPLGGVVSVELTAVSNDGKPVSQKFSLQVIRDQLHLADKGSAVEPKAQSSFVALENNVLELPNEITKVTSESGNTLLLAHRYLGVLSPDGKQINQSFQLDQDYLAIAERPGYFLAIANNPPTVFKLDKQTLKVEKRQGLGDRRLMELALHPDLPISYISADVGGELPNHRFFLFDEKRFEGRSVDEWIGGSMKVAPNRKYLVTTYADSYERGERLLINPDRIHIVPEYGFISWMLRYKLDSKGFPELDDIRDKMESNPNGIALSTEGKLMTLRSRGNNTGFSAWPTDDFTKLPTLTPNKEFDGLSRFHIHPQLPLAVVYSEDRLVLVQTETGKMLQDLSFADPLPIGAKYHQAFFSGDGTAVMFEFSVGSVRYLKAVELDLNASMKKELQRWADRNRLVDSTFQPSASGQATSNEKVALVELDGLSGVSGQEKMSPADVARQYSGSVVVVSCSDSVGTGFVIGSEGYILTCAHCVTDVDSLEIKYKSDRDKMYTCKATVVGIDEERDMALLKAKISKSLPSLQLAIGTKIETGADVTVIGHPAAGEISLDYTMTRGIVSNASRKGGDVELIQTSAAVNPGCSGGPMFDQYGRVIGMVVLKARIEGAGFAIAPDSLAQFLMENATVEGDDVALERHWFDEQGNGPLIAKLKAASLTHVVVLRSSDGKEYTIPMQKLSESDKEFVRLFRRQHK